MNLMLIIPLLAVAAILVLVFGSVPMIAHAGGTVVVQETKPNPVPDVLVNNPQDACYSCWEYFGKYLCSIQYKESENS